MRSSPAHWVRFFLLLVLSAALFGCAPATPTANPNLTWAVSLSKYDVKSKLEAVVTVKQYTGSTDELHHQYPNDGDVFVILNLTINKQGTAQAAFDWSQLTVQDSSGKSYPRVANDSYLETYSYTPRLTGLPLQVGSHQGWVCYELPEQAANGALTLVYSGEGSQQEITVKK